MKKEAIAKLPLPGKSMILSSIARADLSARSVPTRTFSIEQASRNGCNGRQKRGFPAAGSFAIASKFWIFFLCVLFASPVFSQVVPTPTPAQAAIEMAQGITPPQAAPQKINQGEQGLNPSMVSKLAVLAGLSLLPFAIMLLTSFTKIVVVLSLLRNALGVQNTPPNQVLNGIALLVTIYVMFPTGLKMYKASEPVWQNAPATMFSAEAAAFVVQVIDESKEPLRDFLQNNCASKHMNSFYKLGMRVFPEPYKQQLKPNDFIVLIPSFITSQLKSAFEIGVLIYLPFFVIDLVVSNILLAMGMMMLSPLTIALPIKLLLIVMIDGWTVLVQGLAMTFR